MPKGIYKRSKKPWNTGLTRSTSPILDQIAKQKEGVPRPQSVKDAVSKANKGKLIGDLNPAKRPEVREKISEALTGREVTWDIWNKGKTKETDSRISEYSKKLEDHEVSEETRSKIAKSKIGKLKTEETKDKIRATMKVKAPFKGKHLPEETKDKIRETQARLREQGLIKQPTKDTKPERIVKQYLINNGIQFIDTKSIRTNEHGITYPDIFIEPNICIYVDGCYYHDCPICGHKGPKDFDVRTNDINITNRLIQLGYNVVRVWEHEVLNGSFTTMIPL